MMEHPQLVPSFILQQYEAGQQRGRLQAASLFVDVSGFTTVTNTLAQHGTEAVEAMASIMNNLWEPLVDTVYAYGGFITGFAGDAFTALFPVEGEDEFATIVRMIHTAERVQEHIARHPTQSSRFGTFPFAVKLGLDIGDVEWGVLEPKHSELAASYFFSGSAVDGAAAAEHHAQKGFIVLSQRLAERLAGQVSVQPLGGGYARFLKNNLPPTEQKEIPRYEPTPATFDVFVPDAVQNKVVQGEFRPVISVFVNLMGISTTEQLQIFMQSVFDLQTRYGGYISSVDFGDKGCNLLLFWGMPTARANDLDRALGFVLDIPKITPGTFKAGITLRSMYAGFTGSSRRGDYSCYGAGVNLAARLMVAAPWGDVWLEERVASKASTRFQIEDRGLHPFKGFAEPQPVQALIGHKTEAAAFRTAFAGRQAEMAEIGDFLRPMFGPTPSFAGMLVVEGEAGLGKSRLVYEAVNQAEQGCQVITCKTDELIPQALGPFRYWLQNFFDQSSEQSDTLNKQAFNRKLDQVINSVQDASVADELNRLRSCLGDLLELHWENSLYAQLDPEARHNTTLLALRSLLRAICVQQPAILIIEDLQWADEATLDFVSTLSHSLSDYPLAIVLTQRPTKQVWGEDVAYSQLTLDTLSKEDLKHIAESMLDGPVEDKIVRLLVQRAEGNPFFAEQILFYLKEADAFALRDGEWRLVKDKAEAPLPADIRGIFTARLDALRAEVKQVVQAASILGREFDLHLLARLVDANGNLEQKVSQAEAEAIWSEIDNLRYLFQHGFLRDAAYQMQLQAHRRELHYRAAEALQELYQDESEDVIEVIAFHYATAVQQGLDSIKEKAIPALQRAGERAADAYENRMAVDYFTQAIDLLEDDDQRLIDLYFAREASYNILGDRAAQQQDLAALDGLTADNPHTEQRARMLLRKAQAARLISQYDQALTFAEEALSLSQVANLPGIEIEANFSKADTYRHKNEFDKATTCIDTALSMLEHSEDDDLQGKMLNVRAIIEASRGNLDAAQRSFEQALTRFQEQKNFVGEYGALGNLGTLQLSRDNHRMAKMLYERALEIAETRGHLDGQGMLLNNLGWLSILMGQTDEAKGYLERALSIALEVHNLQLGGYCYLNLGNIAYYQHELEVAQARYTEAVKIAGEISIPVLRAEALFGLSDTLLALGDTMAAIEHYQQVIALREEVDQQHLIPEVQARLALAYLAAGQVDPVRDVIDAVEQFLAGEGDLTVSEYPIRVYLNLAQVYAAFDNQQTAADYFERAYAQLQDQLEAFSEEPIRQALSTNIPWNRVMMDLHQEVEAGEGLVHVLLASIGFVEEAQPEAHEAAEAPQPDEVPSIADYLVDEPQEEEEPTPEPQGSMRAYEPSERVHYVEVETRDAPSPNLQEARQQIAFLEGRLSNLDQLLTQVREDARADLREARHDYTQQVHDLMQAHQAEIKEMARELGRAEATIDILKAQIDRLRQK